MVSGKKLVLENLTIFLLGYIETNVAVHRKCSNPNISIPWHDCLKHPGSIMMCQIIKEPEYFLPSDYLCSACSQGKLITKSSPSNIAIESLAFLEKIQCDICEPIHPPGGQFRYFMVLIDASTRLSLVCLLYTKNVHLLDSLLK